MSTQSPFSGIQQELVLPIASAPRPLSVSELTLKVKGLVENEIGTVWVRGEISNFKPSAAGHLYLSLKDADATLSCAIFRGVSSKLKFTPKDGMEVVARGRLSVYAPRGSYQLIIEHVEPLGHGALQLAFEQLKQKLLKEGLFDAAKKRPIPPYPKRIAVVTSPTGAVLQDILNVLSRRNTAIGVTIVPTMVQGDDAVPKIVEAIRVSNAFKLGDVIVVARGGGSMEDLWCFNHEDVVRAVANSQIPVISAVGHETDFTLCDFAADLRAPTPSAAAELVSKNRLELLESLSQMVSRLRLTMGARIATVRRQLFQSEAKLVSPVARFAATRNKLQEAETRLRRAIEGKLPPRRQDIDELSMRLERSLTKKYSEKRATFERLTAALEALSPLKVLGRGYTLIHEDENGRLLKSRADAAPGRKVTLVFHDGKAPAQIL